MPPFPSPAETTSLPSETPAGLLELTVLVPARDEQDVLGGCLESLLAQASQGWELGRHWELIVIDDGSRDRTGEIARSFAGVTVLAAPPLPEGWTGKANACWTGAQAARGQWLLFTDADTVHAPGSLGRALVEAQRHGVGMLSWSPLQLVNGLLARMVMPLVFSELASAYPPRLVNDPEHRIAAANGQFLLVRRDAYRQVGGHAGVATSLVEDVDLAFAIKRSRLGLRFRYAPEMISARMYRSSHAMWQGWTKNLALLIDNTLALAAWRALDVALLLGLPLLALGLWEPIGPIHSLGRLAVDVIWLRTVWRVGRRAARSNFGVFEVALAFLGLPFFVVLLGQSWYTQSILRRAVWKGRSYPTQRQR